MWTSSSLQIVLHAGFAVLISLRVLNPRIGEAKSRLRTISSSKIRDRALHTTALAGKCVRDRVYEQIVMLKSC